MEQNLILISADQLRYDVLGKGYTPNLDMLAGESVCFDNAYCASPLCVPARGSLFTGLCPNSTGSRINPWEEEDAAHGNVRAGIDHLYDMMERGGWDCIHSGKQHLFTEGGKLEDRPGTRTKWLATEQTYKEFLKKNGKRMPGGARFRSPVPEMIGRERTIYTTCSNADTGCYEEGEDFYFDGYFVKEAIKGLRERDTSKPLFLSAMFLAPHPPFDIPMPWYGKYSLDEVILPDNVGVWYPGQSPLQLYNVTGALGGCYTRDEWKESWRAYLGLVSLLDSCVGRLLEELKRQKIYDESLILFTSDHGEMLGSHRLFQKMCMYQESVKVPLFIKLPRQESDQVSTNTGHVTRNISHVDVLPTLCDYLGIAPEGKMEGTSLRADIEGREKGQDKPVFIQYDGNSCLSGFQRAVISGGYKLILDVFKNERWFELYHIEEDVQEKENLLMEEKLPSGQGLLQAKHLFGCLLSHMLETGDELVRDGSWLKTEADSQYVSWGL